MNLLGRSGSNPSFPGVTLLPETVDLPREPLLMVEVVLADFGPYRDTAHETLTQNILQEIVN
jgi:hypothetical protein